MKKAILLLMYVFIAYNIYAQKHPFGNGLYWELNNGVLTISGNGRMPDFSWHTDEPWMKVMTSVKKVIIEEGILSIGNYAFSIGSTMGDGPSSVVIPKSVKSIGEFAFNSWHNLTSITIPDSVMSIGKYAFQNCRSLSTFSLPNIITEIQGGTFSGCQNLRNVEIPESVTSIKWSAFEGCDKLSIIIPTSVVDMRYHTFSDKAKVIRAINGPNNTIFYTYRENGLWGLKAYNNKVIIQPELNVIEPCGKWFLRFSTNGYWGVMNYQGKIIIPTDRGYTKIGDFVNLTKRFSYEMDGYKGECNQLGVQVSKIKVETPKQDTSVASSSNSSSTSNNSGNSNSGSSTSTVIVEHHRDPVPVQEWVDCTGCGGTGACFMCGGARTYYRGDRLVTCVHCRGKGDCPTCNGNRGRYVTVYK